MTDRGITIHAAVTSLIAIGAVWAALQIGEGPLVVAAGGAAFVAVFGVGFLDFKRRVRRGSE